MKYWNLFRYGVHNFFYTLLTLPRAWRFMLNHRLWEGLRSYGWVAKLLAGVGIIGSLYVLGEVSEWWASHDQISLAAITVGEDGLLLRLWKDFTGSLSDGVMNYVILVLLEVIIFHFMRRTLKIVLNKEVKDAHTFKPFYQAQKRMIAVSFIAVVAQEILVGITEDYGTISKVAELYIQATILGYPIVDNYNEQFDLSISQSIRNTYRRHLGICFGLGLPLYLLFKIPLFGALVGPLLVSVTAAIVLRERSDLHIIGYQMSEKEKEKAEKKARKAAKKAARKSNRLHRSPTA